MIANYADHSANEPTFLAWVRTAMAVVGFGLAAARIGAAAVTMWSEALLLGIGAGVIGVAFVRMRHVRMRHVRARHVRMRHVRARVDATAAIDDDTLPTDALLFVLVAALFALLAVFAVHVG